MSVQDDAISAGRILLFNDLQTVWLSSCPANKSSVREQRHKGEQNGISFHEVPDTTRIVDLRKGNVNASCAMNPTPALLVTFPLIVDF